MSETTYRIKPLEWRSDTELSPIAANTTFGTYVIIDYRGVGLLRVPGGTREYSCDSIEHGKQLAWEHWRERITKALEVVE